MEIYVIKNDYIKYLRTLDSRVPLPHKSYTDRMYVGIIVTENNHHYFIPLTSPKEKHRMMKNKPDFIKIDNGNLGALNLNNMIPVPKNSYKEVKINNLINSDDKRDVFYGYLLLNQRKWLNENETMILNKANKLYKAYINQTLHSSVINRCVNFPELEKASLKYETRSHKR